MAWDEWEQLKSQAAEGQPTHMQLNQTDPGMGGGPTAEPSSYGDLQVSEAGLAKIGEHAHDLFVRLWEEGRSAVPTTDKAAGNLATQGFALGGALQQVSTRWDEQLKSLRDACGHISNHMRVTKKLHAGDEDYIYRQMSSIDALDAGFNDRVGEPGKPNPVYGEPSKKKGD